MQLLENDGCSFFFDQWNGQSLLDCCAAHDAAFSVGTSFPEFWQAGVALFHCAWAINPIVAVIMLVGVTSPPAILLFVLGRKRPRK